MKKTNRPIKIKGTTHKDGQYWAVVIPRLHIHTQGTSFKDALVMAADAVETVIGLPGFKANACHIAGKNFELTFSDDAPVKALIERRRLAYERSVTTAKEARVETPEALPSRRKMKAWMKLLSEDHDGENTFFLKILILKLEFMKKHFEKSKIGYNGPKNSREISKAIALLKNAIDEDHPETIKAIGRLEKRFGKRKTRIRSEPNGALGKFETTQVIFTSEWDKLPKRRRDLANSLLAKIYKENEGRQRRDTSAAFSMIATKIWNWWD